jgi:hypothetical protein
LLDRLTTIEPSLGDSASALRQAHEAEAQRKALDEAEAKRDASPKAERRTGPRASRISGPREKALGQGSRRARFTQES